MCNVLISQQEEQTTKYPALGKLVYNLFDECISFDQNMRQLGPAEEEFRKILESQHKGKLSKEQWEMLSTRAIVDLPEDERQMFISEATKLCATRRACSKFNIESINKLDSPKALVHAENVPDKAAKTPSNKAGNLQVGTYI